MEAKAFADARPVTWEAMVELIGQDEAMRLFAGKTSEQIEYFIQRIVNGFRDSMVKQARAGVMVPAAVSVSRSQPDTVPPAAFETSAELLDDEIPF